MSLFIAGHLQARTSANHKIGGAPIGCIGMYNLRDHIKLPRVECIVLCDVYEPVPNERAAEITKTTGKPPTLFKDYRKLLEDNTTIKPGATTFLILHDECLMGDKII